MMIKQKIREINGVKYRLLIPRSVVKQRIITLAQKVKEDYRGYEEPPILMGVMTGGLFLLTDLSRALEAIGFRHRLDTIEIKRYHGDEQGGAVHITKLPSANIIDKHVIIVEDVVDEGISLNFINAFINIKGHAPATLSYFVLARKKEVSQLIFPLAYVGFDIGQAWIVGEGMDSGQLFRGLKGIWEKFE